MLFYVRMLSLCLFEFCEVYLKKIDLQLRLF